MLVHERSSTESFLRWAGGTSQLVLPDMENFPGMWAQPRFYLHLQESIKPKTPSLYTALPRDLLVQLEPGDIPVCTAFKPSTPTATPNIKLTFLHATILQCHQHQGNRRV